MRLFWFHHAGGSAASFRAFRGIFPSQVDVTFVEYPGRGRWFSQAPIEALDTLVDHLLPRIEHALASPFAFFGHSMGALVAFELARRLEARRMPLPRWMGLSGSPSPRWPGRIGRAMHLLGDAQLCAELRALGGTPEEVLDSPELVRIVLRALRADYKVAETWSAPPASFLRVPTTVYGGSDDRDVPRLALERWEDEVGAPFGVRMFPGGHFYLLYQPDRVAHAILDDLAPFSLSPLESRPS